MPSRRMIDPAFWQSETVAALPISVRYFFIGLFSNADDQGRMKAHPALIRSKLYPYDDIPLTDIEEMLGTLVADDFIIEYSVDGRDYLQIKNWWTYQRPHWAWPSEHPAPEGWADRMCYRKGNTPVKENWDQDDTEPQDESGDSGATVEPERGQSGATVESAPSTRVRGSTSTRVRGSEKSSLAATAAPAPPDNGPSTSADYQEMRKAWGELFPDKPQPRATTRALQSKVRTRMGSAHFRDNWLAAMKRAAKSKFLIEGAWFDFGWLVKNDANYEKCLNGNYDDGKSPRQGGGSRASPRDPESIRRGIRESIAAGLAQG